MPAKAVCSARELLVELNITIMISKRNAEIVKAIITAETGSHKQFDIQKEIEIQVR